MPGRAPLPAAFAAWLARRLASGAAAELLAAEHGLAAATLAEARIGALARAFAAGEAGSSDPSGRTALLEAAIDALLAQGRPFEAARLTRLCSAARLCTGARSAPADEPPVQETAEARLARTLAGFTPEERADWDSLGYETWVVPPGTGRRPLASLNAEWVCAADRWRVLEELTRVEDPAERARVLDHFRHAGLDPGADHPAFAGAIDPPAPAPAARGEGAPAGTEPAAAPPDPPAGRDPAFHALLVRLGQEAEAYHGAGRARRAALAWRRHARELGVPVPAHAGLGPEPGAAVVSARSAPGTPEPSQRSGGSGAAGWPHSVRIRPPEPEGPGWPWAPEDGVSRELLAERAARAPRPAPPGRTTVPQTPASPAPPAAAPPPVAPPPVPPPPVTWAQEPMTPTRLAKLRGDWPWWCQ